MFFLSSSNFCFFFFFYYSRNVFVRDTIIELFAERACITTQCDFIQRFLFSKEKDRKKNIAFYHPRKLNDGSNCSNVCRRNRADRQYVLLCRFFFSFSVWMTLQNALAGGENKEKLQPRLSTIENCAHNQSVCLVIFYQQ